MRVRGGLDVWANSTEIVLQIKTKVRVKIDKLGVWLPLHVWVFNSVCKWPPGRYRVTVHLCGNLNKCAIHQC